MKSPVVSLSLVTSREFFEVARDMTEKASLAMGLGKSEALKVAAATEEIFIYLCDISPGKPLTVNCIPGGYCVEVQFVFFSEQFPLENFNLTSRVELSDEKGMEAMGLLIASRIVDKFSVESSADNRLCLTLVKEKQYDRAPDLKDVKRAPAPDSFRVRPAEPEEAGYLSRLVQAIYPPETIPRPLVFPGMIADMLRHGEVEMLVAVSPGGEIIGGISWEWKAGMKIADCHGPYVFTQNRDPAICEELLNRCISHLARLPLVGLVNRRPNQDLPRQYFERIGELPLSGPDGIPVALPHFFRQMHEDPGAVVWADTRLVSFLEEKYQALALPRKILCPGPLPDASSGRSVLFTRFERTRRTATIWPVCRGNDIGSNLTAHLEMLKRENTGGIFFSLDLGRPWQAEFAPPVMDAGFSPRIVLPYGGEGDIVLFSL